MSDKIDANDYGRENGPEALRAEAVRMSDDAPELSNRPVLSLSEVLMDDETLNPPERVKTGYAALDEALLGGLVLCGMYLIAGLNSSGKSCLALNIARRLVMDGRRVLYLSLENQRHQDARRLIAMEAQVPLAAVERLNKVTLDARQRDSIRDAIKNLKALPLSFIDSENDLHKVSNLIRQNVSGGEVVVVDQSSWLAVENAENAYTEATTICRALKALARELKIVVVVLVQINRAGAAEKVNNKPLALHHLRDTGRWEQDCDGALVIQGAEYTGQVCPLQVDLLKHRHGPRGLSIKLKYTPAQFRIDDDEDSLKPALPQAIPAGDEPKPVMTAQEFAARYVPKAPEKAMKRQLIISKATKDMKGTEAAALFEEALHNELFKEIPLGGTGNPKAYQRA